MLVHPIQLYAPHPTHLNISSLRPPPSCHQAKRLEELDKLYREEVVSRKRAHNALQVRSPTEQGCEAVTAGVFPWVCVAQLCVCRPMLPRPFHPVFGLSVSSRFACCPACLPTPFLTLLVCAWLACCPACLPLTHSQDAKGKIRVYCRVRPLLEFEAAKRQVGGMYSRLTTTCSD